MTALIDIRRRSGFTQAEIAAKAQVSVRAYQNYEYDSRIPDVQTAIRIANVLEVPVEVAFSTSKV